MIPRKLWRATIHVPIPDRRAAAAFSSMASSDGDEPHNSTSTPARSPTIEYVNVVTSDWAFTALQNSSAERHRWSLL